MESLADGGSRISGETPLSGGPRSGEPTTNQALQHLGQWLRELDRILRGEATQIAALGNGALRFPIGGVAIVTILLGMVYGDCAGVFSAVNRTDYDYRFMLAAMIKVPALFALTLMVTLPSLYVFNALVGSRLTLQTLLRLMVATLGVTMAVLASLGPIVAFFSFNTATYSFTILMNVLVFTLSGLLGLTFLLRTLHRLDVAQRRAVPMNFAANGAPQAQPAHAPPVAVDVMMSGNRFAESAAGAVEPIVAEVVPVEAPAVPGPLDHIGPRHSSASVKLVFAVWMVLFGLVGSQMSWLLRPFIGSPGLPFEWFRHREGNFFEAVAAALQNLFG